MQVLIVLNTRSYRNHFKTSRIFMKISEVIPSYNHECSVVEISTSRRRRNNSHVGDSTRKSHANTNNHPRKCIYFYFKGQTHTRFS
jgi:hypothetical protein